MTLPKNKKLMLIGLILFIAFLIEWPLYTQTISLLSFMPAIGYLITSIIGYVAMLACVLLITKQYFNTYDFFKAIGLILTFAVIDQIVPVLLFTEIIALCYQIVRPVIAILFIWLAIKAISGCKVKKDTKLLVIGVIVFALSVVFNVLEYIRLTTVVQNMWNDFFYYLTLITSSRSVYNSLAYFCGYVLIYLSFASFAKSIPVLDTAKIEQEENAPIIEEENPK